MDEVEEILAFVEKHKEGVQWGQIEDEFRKKWSKGKLVNHWKRAKSYLEKSQPKTGYPKYVIKPKYKTLAEKAFLMRQIVDAISKGEFKQLEVNPLRLNNLKKEMFERARGDILLEATEKTRPATNEETLRKGLLKSTQEFLSFPFTLFKELTKSEETRKNEQIELIKALIPLFTEVEKIEQEVEKYLDFLAENTKIRVIYPQSEPMPNLTDNHLESLLNIVSKHAMDKKGKLRTQFHVLVSFYKPSSI